MLINKSQEHFSKECKSHGIKYQIHPYDGAWNLELFIKESRFADLVVISEELICQVY